MYTFLKKGAPALALLGLALGSCQPELDAPKADRGSADFSRYIAVGNSLTAGYGDNGLYREGQLSSYPSILAQQFKLVGGGEFNQPLFTETQANGTGYLRLAGFTPQGTPITAPVTTNLALRAGSTAARPLYTKYTDPINNLGVPGIRMSDIETPGYGSVQGNPLFERITPDATPTQTYRQRVAASNPTFFSFWLGNNDVLGYATAGGSSSSVTPLNDFTAKANAILDDLTANGAKGIVGLIPDVTNVPFFTTVGPTLKATLAGNSIPAVVVTTGLIAPPAPVTRLTVPVANIRDASGGSVLFTLTFSPYAGLIGQRTGRVWRDLYRQTGQPAAGLSLFLLAAQVDTTQLFGLSAGNPIPSTFVLDATEQTTVSNATNGFNTALRNKAAAKGLAVFDANAFFASIAANGFGINATTNSASFLSGNLFSLDGVHPTPRGYAIIANEMVRTINSTYGASIPFVNPNDYRGVIFPQ
ncbi:SGNH/GDSL hydrolase family protein [Hymenobacter sp. CRA2]|uniref:SGNH/GDSL hydrolase family protein n=1 Tax=Hymenobacter sp. CRA2 TaxID=1955620 RepID=UPI00098EE17C|nr:SGNH/GDSL hydrolase family protein [Hymenobacter sp. CRA2]OON70732.1 hypothetical protein B0919_01580 [Hymenobacter sp. CRA2]